MELQNYKRCSNGHYFKSDLEKCPYCGALGQNVSNNSEETTQNISANNVDKTMIFNENNQDKDKTKVYGQDTYNEKVQSSNPVINNLSNGEKTVITIPTNDENKPVEHSSDRRRLVGWIVSYELDPYGLSFGVYEGRNKVGRSVECDITISDASVSEIHAIILYRNEKYYLLDQGSSNGTYLNNNDIDFDSVEINDGDFIIFGKGRAKFKFKSSL